jgi:predicted alpha/beta hydrolase
MTALSTSSAAMDRRDTHHAAASAMAAGTNTTHLVAADGRHLAATWTEPSTPARAVAVIHSAAAVPRGYYGAFASWLASRGYAVLSYDYRGIGGSRRGATPKDLRDETAVMADWAVLDMSAAHAAAHARRHATGSARALPLLLIGHSFGGNSVGFSQGLEHADAILTVASQVGEPRIYPGVHRWVASFFMYAWLPVVTRVLGHAPGWAIGGNEGMPRGVAQQWARWARTRGWAFADASLKAHRSASAVVAPVHLWNISDDLRYAPARAVDALAEQFRHAAVQRHELQPRDVGVATLGHFGAFRRQPGAPLWQKLLAPIEAATPALRDAGLTR